MPKRNTTKPVKTPSTNPDETIGNGFAISLTPPISSMTPGSLIASNSSKYGARFSYQEVIQRVRPNPYRSAQLAPMPYLSQNEKVAVINETLSRMQKMMLEDAFISDATIRRCITLYAMFLLGKRTRTVIDVNRDFLSPEMQQQVVADTLNTPEVEKMRARIDQTNRQVKLREKLEAATIQAKIGGRSVLLVEEEQGKPVDLKILNWGKLGKVYADPKTWELLAVEYSDRPRDKPLRAEEIIYFPWQDYNVSPDSLYMGASAVLPVVDIARVIRSAVSEDLNEVMNTQWASSGAVKFPPNTLKTAMAEFVREFKGGRWHATSQDVQIQTYDLKPKIFEIMQTVRELQLMIIEGLGIPDWLVTSKDVPNRAVADLSMNVWREADLNHSRSWLQGIIEPQWYDTLMILENPGIDIHKFYLKAKLEFEDITFETLKERAETVIMLLQNGLMTIEKACKILDLEDVYEQIVKQQKLLEQQRKEELEIAREDRLRRSEGENARNNGSTSNAFGRNREDGEDEEDDEEEEEERPTPTPRTRNRRPATREASVNLVMQQYESDKKEMIARLVRAEEQGKQIQQQQLAKDKRLHEAELELKQTQIALENQRMENLKIQHEKDKEEIKTSKRRQEAVEKLERKVDSMNPPPTSKRK